jgi:hypothetical protein
MLKIVTKVDSKGQLFVFDTWPDFPQNRIRILFKEDNTMAFFLRSRYHSLGFILFVDWETPVGYIKYLYKSPPPMFQHPG